MAWGLTSISLAPLPFEQVENLPTREQQLQAIGDNIAYWLKWTTREHEAEELTVTPDTHVWLNGFDGCPPHWPSVGQLTLWLKVLRDSGSGPEGENSRSEVEGEAPQSGLSDSEGIAQQDNLP
jgi:hypothetical protein